MELNVFMVKQILTEDPDHEVQGFLDDLAAEMGGTISLKGAEEVAEGPFRVIYIASGGSENQFRQHFDILTDRPCFLLTRRDGNSLAAAMEILAYIRKKGKKGEILHGQIPYLAKRLKEIQAANDAVLALRGKKLGVIGMPSDWLISSDIDEKALLDKLGMTAEPVPMAELYAEIEKHEYAENEYTRLLKKQNFNSAEIEKALWIYGAFRRIADNHGFMGITVRCFDLLTSVHSTGCLGLAILNAEGIYGGCEGDVTTLLSMAILGELSHRPQFMCNPSRMDPETGEITLAHCTLPLNMPYEFQLDTHYESGIGVAIAGSIPEGPCTIFKCANDLSRHYCEKGEILTNLRERTLCRSQIVMKLPSLDYFLREPINNHHVVCTGDWTGAVREFFALLG